MTRFENAAGGIVENILTATSAGGLNLSAFLDGVPIDLSVDERLLLVAHLRLAPKMLDQDPEGLSIDGLLLLAFLRMSLALRNRNAARMVTTLSRWPLSPRKFALALGYEGDWVTLRYFRDLDFSTSREFAEVTIRYLALLGFFVGDIDPDDWRCFIVPDEAVLARGLKTTPEMHLISVAPLNDTRLRDLYKRVFKLEPWLNECQFYGFVGPQFTARTFVDVAFHERHTTPEEEYLSPMSRYLAQLAEDATADIASGRLGLNQVIELRSLDVALRLKGEPRPRALCALVEMYGEPWLAESIARASLERFVAEKLDRLTMRN